MMTAVLLLIVAIFFVASSAIAKECYDKNKAWADTKKTNGKFINGMLGAGVLCILISFVMIYMAYNAGKAAVAPNVSNVPNAAKVN